LDALRDKAHAEFYRVLRKDPLKAFMACSFLQSPIGWEISELLEEKDKFSSKKCGTGTCRGTVQVNGKCHWASEVNYFWWGLANHLCSTAIFRLPQVGVPELIASKEGIWSENRAVAGIWAWRSITAL